MSQAIMHVGSVETIVHFFYNGQHWSATAEPVYADVAEEWDAAEFNSMVMQRFSSTQPVDAPVDDLCADLLAQIGQHEPDLSEVVVFEEVEA